MVVHGAVEVLTVCWMAYVVVLRAFDIEVRYPAKLAVDISVLGNPTVIWHSGALDFIHLKRIWLPFRLD